MSKGSLVSRSALLGLGLALSTAGAAGSAAADSLDPAVLAASLDKAPLVQHLTTALGRSGSLVPPFAAPTRQLFQEADPVSRERGVHGREIVIMNTPASQSGVEIYLYEAEAVAARHVETLAVTPESLDAQGHWRVVRSAFHQEGPDGKPAIELTCTRADLGPQRRPTQVRCAYHRPGSQVSVASYSLGTAPLSDAEVEAVIRRHGPVLYEAQDMANVYEQAERAAAAAQAASAAAVPAAPPAPIQQLAVSQETSAGPAPSETASSGTTLGGGTAPLIGVAPDCTALVGDWTWYIGGRASFSPMGQGIWKARPEAASGRKASWTCNPGTGVFTVTWEQGVVDSLAVAPDGQSLEGQNQHGVTVTAKRYDPERDRMEKQMQALTKIDPVLVGVWELEVQLASPQGPIAVRWTIRPEGTYKIDAGPMSHAGKLDAKDGKWQLTSETNGFTDGGTYETSGWTSFITKGRLGPGRWWRREPLLKLETVDMNGEAIPVGLPRLAAIARHAARGWHRDAELVDLDLGFADTQKRKVQIKMSWFSPGSGAGLWITAAPEGGSFYETKAANWGGGAIPDGFLDLPDVWAIARQRGLPPPLSGAGLRIWHPPGQEPVLAWSIASARADHGLNIDAASGQVLQGDLSGYVAAYNAAWEKAVEGLRRLFARPPPQVTSSSFDWSSGGSSSSSSSSSGSSSSGSDWGRDTALQNAWGAGDMDAYNRILNGEGSWSDSSNYGD